MSLSPEAEKLLAYLQPGTEYTAGTLSKWTNAPAAKPLEELRKAGKVTKHPKGSVHTYGAVRTYTGWTLAHKNQ